jgi:hypothetical protein
MWVEFATKKGITEVQVAFILDVIACLDQLRGIAINFPLLMD